MRLQTLLTTYLAFVMAAPVLVIWFNLEPLLFFFDAPYVMWVTLFGTVCIGSGKRTRLAQENISQIRERYTVEELTRKKERDYLSRVYTNAVAFVLGPVIALLVNRWVVPVPITKFPPLIIAALGTPVLVYSLYGLAKFNKVDVYQQFAVLSPLAVLGTMLSLISLVLWPTGIQESLASRLSIYNLALLAAAVFFVLSLVLQLRYRRQPSTRTYFAPLLAFAAAIMFYVPAIVDAGYRLMLLNLST